MVRNEKITRNIGVFTSHFSWDGGIDFLVFLTKGIYANGNKIYLFINHPYLNFIKFFILRFSKAIRNPTVFIKQREWKKYETKICLALTENNIPFEVIRYNHFEFSIKSVYKKNKIDLIIPVMKSFSNAINWIGYIPDLQHKYFPNWFSEKEKISRDRMYSDILKKSRLIIVNSKAVKEDLKRFYSVDGKNIFSIPFIPLASGKEVTKDSKVLDKYNLKNPFFLISNQFWKHKNHSLAFEGFIKFCKKSTIQYDLVCTGDTNDYRFPNYFSELLDFVNKSGFEDRFKICGYIPKEDQMNLLYNCSALIQPTLFEGGPGGGSVYNALAIGKTCVISDIPINKEIESDRVYFFKNSDSDDLAEKLLKVIDSHHEELSISRLNEINLEKLANVMCEIIDDSIQKFKK